VVIGLARSNHRDTEDTEVAQRNPKAGTTYHHFYAAYHSTAKKWQVVPAITKRCQMKWL
jgi:hypothetical protein